MSVYIQAAEQISIQEPLCHNWLNNPIYYSENFVKAIDPNYKDLISSTISRRTGRLLKRALATSFSVIQQAGVTIPDAIITGTGLGCIENTGIFLLRMVQEGEQFLQPTYFMQSTHNTISSQIAVSMNAHGYNNTYSHGGISFESCLLDAFMQFDLNLIHNALIGSHDEMVAQYFSLMNKINTWKEGIINTEILRKADSPGTVSGESSTSFLLENTKKDSSLCEVKGIEILFQPTFERLQDTLDRMLSQNRLSLQNIDAVVLGMNGDEQNDQAYRSVSEFLFPHLPQLWFKHLFGESFSSSALGCYVAAACLKHNSIPSHV